MQGTRPRVATFQAEINVTPLVDVALVLLIIFMVVTPLVIDQVQLPAGKNPQIHPEHGRQLQIFIEDRATVGVAGVIIRTDQLAGELERLSALGEHREVVIKAAKIVSYGEVLRVLQLCRAARFEDVALAATKLEVETR